MEPDTSDVQPEERREGSAGSAARRPTGRILGIIPNSGRNRLFFAWGVANLVLTFLPVWDVAFNSARIVGGILPLTILWSYLVFASNMFLGITLYYTWVRRWAQKADWEGRFSLATDAGGRDGEEGATS